MIDILFRQPDSAIIVRVIGKTITFAQLVGPYQKQFSPIEKIKLSISGIAKEWPDLADKPIEEMRSEAIKRFKEGLTKFNAEMEIAEYSVKELRKNFLVPLKLQRAGFRPQNIPKEWLQTE